MIDLTCRLCAGSGVYDFSPTKETCGMCQGHTKFVDAKAMLVAAIELAKKQQEPVIEVVMGLVLHGVDVRERSPESCLRRLRPLTPQGTIYCDTGGMRGSSMPSMKVSVLNLPLLDGVLCVSGTAIHGAVSVVR